MGASVSNFVTSVAKTIAKGATTALGGMIPVIGPALASGLNSLYRKGGVVTRRFEAGGVVPAGFKAKPINSVSQLVNLMKQFPEEAMRANLSVSDVKDAVAEMKAPAMAYGGMMGPMGPMSMALPSMSLQPVRGQMMAHGGMAHGGMSGQRAARGRGGGIN